MRATWNAQSWIEWLILNLNRLQLPKTLLLVSNSKLSIFILPKAQNESLWLHNLIQQVPALSWIIVIHLKIINRCENLTLISLHVIQINGLVLNIPEWDSLLIIVLPRIGLAVILSGDALIGFRLHGLLLSLHFEQCRVHHHLPIIVVAITPVVLSHSGWSLIWFIYIYRVIFVHELTVGIEVLWLREGISGPRSVLISGIWWQSSLLLVIHLSIKIAHIILGALYRKYLFVDSGIVVLVWDSDILLWIVWITWIRLDYQFILIAHLMKLIEILSTRHRLVIVLVVVLVTLPKIGRVLTH